MTARRNRTERLIRDTIALLAAIVAVGSGLATALHLLHGAWRAAAFGASFSAVWAVVANAAGRQELSRHRVT